MRKQKNKRKKSKFIKPLMAGKYAQEARLVFGERSGRASRFLNAVSSTNQDLEPIGSLAGKPPRIG
ncbi:MULTISPECIES: hypothetical protein [Pseudomonas]|uniref:hypothetical protein n=1 Tax=Pseudomonas TaxID=286 RepID=UPI00098F594B|nr:MULTISPECIES: hypothetical protein [Pseudomonas]MBK3434393.1 hypothetical protein [Pseudomonas fluorescens]AQT92624.1 hypothetical protein B1R45_04885 [Pseudomonas azotoformans]MBK3481520.1 hypothetical protein [Pseudomonas fluorescens]MCF5512153.1 hypothetical protein [Pseudomonas sp. PA-3-6H]MCF5518118.1 hypothetical protein [Pseudomonas sp. PA-3-6E]